MKTSHKKTKTQIFNNLVIILKDRLVGVIFNINNNDPLTTGHFLQIFMVFSSMMAKTNYKSQVPPEPNY